MRNYELMPIDGRKSFYGKAVVYVDGGDLILYSYNTPIIKQEPDGNLIRLWDGKWTMTTGRHIKAFCGLDKKGFYSLEDKNG